MIVTNKVRKLSDMIVQNALEKSEYLPIDRNFLEEEYLNEILSVDAQEFLLCNLERKNNTYTVQLFKCLPELWNDMTYEKMIELINSLTNAFSFYALISFTYQCLGLDIIDLMLDNPKVRLEYKKEITAFFLNQIGSMISDEDSLKEDFERVGTNIQDWVYIKQKLLLDSRFKLATKSHHELWERLMDLNKKYNG